MGKATPRASLRGIARLATQATSGVTRIAEGVHQSVWSTLRAPGGDAPGQTRGITGLVYKAIYGVTWLVGKGADTILARLQPHLDSADATSSGSPRREKLLAALNGVMGDRLLADDNPLAIPMTLRYRGEVLDCQALPPMPEATRKILLLIHGLCMNDLHWQPKDEGEGVDHGKALAAALGYTPVYLRYNSGLHTSQNGRELSALLEQLLERWPVAIEELAIVAHSMGGLVARSALHYGRQDGLRWPDCLKSIVFLGTPHHGAPLERAGNRVGAILDSTPYTAPFTRLVRLRSAGITDLRYGHLLDEDWEGLDRFRRKPDSRRIVPLPAGVGCYTVAATAAAGRSALADRLVGDGLVPLDSALGRHDDERRSLAFAKKSQWIACRTNHLELLRSPAVTRRMARWLAPSKRLAEDRLEVG